MRPAWLAGITVAIIGLAACGGSGGHTTDLKTPKRAPALPAAQTRVPTPAVTTPATAPPTTRPSPPTTPRTIPPTTPPAPPTTMRTLPPTTVRTVPPTTLRTLPPMTTPTTPHVMSGIPQGGGDHDGDNFGGPNDGDGGI